MLVVTITSIFFFFFWRWEGEGEGEILLCYGEMVQIGYKHTLEKIVFFCFGLLEVHFHV